VPPTKMRWNSDAFLGLGVAVGDTEGEAATCALRVLTTGEVPGETAAEAATAGEGDAFTLGLGLGEAVGDGVGLDELAGAAAATHCEKATSTAMKAKNFLIMFSLWFTCKSGDIKPSMVNP
ncbi:MAG: hypothetical protein WCD79_02405, partial [Chthoniobacteraceae bacterium]